MIHPEKDSKRQDKLAAFDRILTIMDELRLNCPWDKKQTWESLRHLSIEEVYELSDAIVQQNPEEIKKELGDIFLHLIFYAKIGEELGVFDIGSVINQLAEKMIHRHPHIYSDTQVADEEEVKKNWEALKKKEKNAPNTTLAGVPRSLPPMTKATRIQSKARGTGFDWDNKEQVWDKVLEELQEFKEAKNKAEQEAELGDVFFSLINYARFIDIDPEYALELTNQKFIKRFNMMEALILNDGKEMQNLNLSEMDAYWDRVKILLRE
jgi:MazG family protein